MKLSKITPRRSNTDTTAMPGCHFAVFPKATGKQEGNKKVTKLIIKL